MPKLTCLRGCPGSGKSTWAFEELKRTGNSVRVNRDSLREMLHGFDAKWSGAREKLTVNAERIIVMDALANGKNVIVDDTNLLGSGTSKWEDLARISGADFVVKDFTGVPIAECIQRDAQREGKARVGRGVIERMALFGGLIDLSSCDKVAIVDIDGTIANLDHRLHFIQAANTSQVYGSVSTKDWNGFFEALSDDTPFNKIIISVNNLKRMGFTVLLLSGRSAHTGHATVEWLQKYTIMFDHIFMRQTGVQRPDFEIKRELFNAMLHAGLRKDAIKIVIDDRESVCEVWRELGLPLVQVDRGSAIQIHPSAMRLAVEIGIPIRL